MHREVYRDGRESMRKRGPIDHATRAEARSRQDEREAEVQEDSARPLTEEEKEEGGRVGEAIYLYGGGDFTGSQGFGTVTPLAAGYGADTDSVSV